MRARACLFVFPLLMTCAVITTADDALLTVAEKTDFQATARHDEVLTLCHALDDSSDAVVLDGAGTIGRGPVDSASDRRRPAGGQSHAKRRKSGKLVVLLVGNIHAGEVCGKEALPMLVREITGPDAKDDLLDDLILLVVPNLNPDGNERVSQDNRPGQNGPEAGMGQRGNADDLDLNRDFVKLETPESSGTGGRAQRLGPAPGDRHAHDQRLDAPLRADLPGPAESGRRPPLVITTSAKPCCRPSIATSRPDPGRQAYFYGDFDASHAAGPATPIRPGSAPTTSACETGLPCSRKRMPMPLTRTAC